MDAVVMGSIGAVVASIVVFCGFLGYWLHKIMNHPPSHD